MKGITYIILCWISVCGFVNKIEAQNVLDIPFKKPSKECLNNMAQLNLKADSANKGALGCGVHIIRTEGKQYSLPASLSFLLTSDTLPNLELLHAICYAHYANNILKDSTWPLPNKALCFSVTEILSIFNNQNSIGFLCLLMEDKSTLYFAMKSLNQIGLEKKAFQKDIINCIKNHLIPYDRRVNGWIDKEMRQPILIELKGSNTVRIKKQNYTFEELKDWLIQHKQDTQDNYVLVTGYENYPDEFGSMLNKVIQDLDISTVTLEDFTPR